MRNKTQQLKTIIQNNKDGFTISYKTLKSYSENKNNAVAITNLKSKYPKKLINQILTTAKSFNQIENKLFIGGWFNQEDKYYYVDLSLILDRETALIVGRLFNQISIFNFNKMQVENLAK